MTFKSEHDICTLQKRWDDKTSFANFAGGDDFLDTVFISRRYGRLVVLKSKPRSAHELFGAVYFGVMLSKKSGGSKIVGFFGLGILDIIIAAAFYFLYGEITKTVLSRGDEKSAYWLIGIAVVILFFLFFTSPKTKKRYKEVIEKVL